MNYDLHRFWVWDKVNKNYNKRIQCIPLFIFVWRKQGYIHIKKFVDEFYFFSNSSILLFFLYTQSVVLITCKIREWKKEKRE